MGFRYTIKQLVGIKRWFDQNPDAKIKIPGMWPDLVLSKDEWHRWMVGCLHEKINRNDRRKWRKLDQDWQTEMRRAQRDLNYRGQNGERLAIHWLPKDLKNRFSHRLWQDD